MKMLLLFLLCSLKADIEIPDFKIFVEPDKKPCPHLFSYKSNKKTVPKKFSSLEEMKKYLLDNHSHDQSTFFLEQVPSEFKSSNKKVTLGINKGSLKAVFHKGVDDEELRREVFLTKALSVLIPEMKNNLLLPEEIKEDVVVYPYIEKEKSSLDINKRNLFDRKMHALGIFHTDRKKENTLNSFLIDNSSIVLSKKALNIIKRNLGEIMRGVPKNFLPKNIMGWLEKSNKKIIMKKYYSFHSSYKPYVKSKVLSANDLDDEKIAKIYMRQDKIGLLSEYLATKNEELPELVDEKDYLDLQKKYPQILHI